MTKVVRLDEVQFDLGYVALESTTFVDQISQEVYSSLNVSSLLLFHAPWDFSRICIKLVTVLDNKPFGSDSRIENHIEKSQAGSTTSKKHYFRGFLWI